MAPQIIEKGTFQVSESAVLKEEYRDQNGTRLSEYCRIEQTASTTVLYVAPREFAPVPYAASSLEYSVSSVYQGEYNHYDHGEVRHQAKTDYTAHLNELTSRVMEKFKPDFLVNPSEGVFRIASLQGIRRVFLDVEAEKREEVEKTVRKWGGQIIHATEGLGFIGREGTKHLSTCKKWIALAPIPSLEAQYELDKVVTVEKRWGEIRSQTYLFNNPFFFLNQEQTSALLGIPNSPRILCSSFMIPGDKIDQVLGECRFLDEWPDEKEEEIKGTRFFVRKKGTVYYDVRVSGDWLPYPVRRGFMVYLGLPIAPYLVYGRHAFSIMSINPVPVSYEQYEYRTMVLAKNRKKKVNPKPKQVKQGVIWYPYWFEGSTPYQRGYYVEVPYHYDASDQAYYGSAVKGDGVFFPSKKKMQEVVIRTWMLHHVGKNPQGSSLCSSLYQDLRQGKKASYIFHPGSLLLGSWRQLPHAFVDRKGMPRILQWTAPELNLGAQFSVFVCTGELSSDDHDYLSSSGFSIDIIKGGFVLRDHFSFSGRVCVVTEKLKSQECQPVGPATYLREQMDDYVPYGTDSDED